LPNGGTVWQSWSAKKDGHEGVFLILVNWVADDGSRVGEGPPTVVRRWRPPEKDADEGVFLILVNWVADDGSRVGEGPPTVVRLRRPAGKNSKESDSADPRESSRRNSDGPWHGTNRAPKDTPMVLLIY